MLGTSVMSAKAAYAIGQSGSMEGPLSAAGKGAEIFNVFSSAYARERREAMSLADFLEGCRNDPGMTASAAERMVAAIGEPDLVDTAQDQRLGRIFFNRTIKIYPTPSTASSAWKTRSSGSWATSSMPRRASKRSGRFSICSARSAAASPRSPSGSRI